MKPWGYELNNTISILLPNTYTLNCFRPNSPLRKTSFYKALKYTPRFYNVATALISGGRDGTAVVVVVWWHFQGLFYYA